MMNIPSLERVTYRGYASFFIMHVIYPKIVLATRIESEVRSTATDYF